MTQVSASIYPLFSSPVANIGVKTNMSVLEKLKTIEYRKTNEIASCETYTTVSNSVLDEFPEQKETLLEYFYYYKDEHLKFVSTDFRITTSWGTKTNPGGYSQYHNHKNSAFSGVFYYDDMSGGDIEFSSTNLDPQSFQFNNPSEINLLNMRLFRITPKKNTLLFFPSYLIHRVTANQSPNARYSLAFNLIPTGTIFAGDSSVSF